MDCAAIAQATRATMLPLVAASLSCQTSGKDRQKILKKMMNRGGARFIKTI